MATRGRLQYQADGDHLIKGLRTFDIHPDLLEKIEQAGEGTIDTIKVNGVTQPITNKTVNITVPVVEDTLGSYSTTNALSANQGRVLYDAIQHLKSIGRFLSLWNAETGLPMDNPQLNPYPYNTGDYYIVSNVGSRNYRPSGVQYVAGQASTEEETETVKVDDFYFYNGTNWFHLSNEGPSLAIDTVLSTTSTNAVENRVITNALNNKADKDDLDDYYTKTEVDDKIEAELEDVVKDGVLTIQKNGTDQGTFSANQATNTTINLTVNKIDVGLENVDNTSDLNKPISTATQEALDGLSDRIDALEDGDIQDIKDDITDLQENKLDKTDLGDATLTVQKNGTAVGTFTANSKTDTTINLELTKSDVGLGNVDNTADVDKPISTATQEALDLKADKSDTYTKTETDAKIDEKIDDALEDNVGDGKITVNQGGTKKGEFTVNQKGDTVIDLDAGSEDGMEYPDFAFVNKTGNNITLDISSKVANPSADFTINAPSEIKDGITYVLRVENGVTPPAMTLGTNITNPYNVDLTLSASKTDTFAFLAVDGKLEMQPTEAEVPENVYTKEEINQMMDDKADAGDVYTKTEVDDMFDNIDLTDYYKKSETYSKTETDALLADKADKTDLDDYYTKTETDALLDDKGDIKYEDFEFATMTGTVIENLSATKDISADTTLTAGTSLKEGMQYLVDVTNTDSAKHTVTFGSASVEIEAGESKKLVFLATSSSTLELQTCSGGGVVSTGITNDTTGTTTTVTKIWAGTESEYNALATHDATTIYHLY